MTDPANRELTFSGGRDRMRINVAGLTEAFLPDFVSQVQKVEILPEHHPIWIAILKRMGEDCRCLVAFEGGNLAGWLFYTVSRTPHGTVMNSMPFIAYGGPALARSNSAVAEALLASLRDRASELGADVLAVGTSPSVSREVKQLYRSALQTTHELENFVQLQKLDKHPVEALPSRRRGPLKRNINKALHHQLRVVREFTVEQLEEWLAIYRERLVEIGAAPYPDSFHRLVHELAVPAGVAQFWGVTDGRKLVGGTLFLLSSSVVYYFSSAYLSEYRDLFPNTLLLDQAFSHFIVTGRSDFNWLSSPGRGGVYEYKARWGAVESRHYYLSTLLRVDTPLLNLTATQIPRLFPGRFVLPFSVFKDQCASGGLAQ